MISVVIASYKEPHTIGKALRSLIPQLTLQDQIIVSAPDAETRDAARRVPTRGIPLLVLSDKGKGKPAALNSALKKATQPLVLLSDGDVYVGPSSVTLLVACMKDPTVGIATGRVVATNTRDTCLGFWAYALTEAFHELRLHKQQTHEVIATGYLYLIRKKHIPFIPETTLADDAYVSHHVLSKGYRIVYEPRAKVYVKYPTTLPDWLRQKKRTAGRVYQLSQRFGVSKLHSFVQELLVGTRVLRHVRSLKEFVWLGGLVVFKLYVWARIFFDYRLWKRTFSRAWERVESTK